MARGTPDEPGSGRSGHHHIDLSRLLIACAITAIAATGGLVVVTMLAMAAPDGPPPGRGGPPPPPVRLQTLAILTVVTGLCVLAWLATLVVFARDQVLARLRDHVGMAGAGPDGDRAVRDALASLREELAADHRAALAALEERMTSLTAEYGEQRETDGYLHGVRVTALAGGEGAEVLQIRRVRAP